MTYTKADREAALLAIEEYNAAYEQGGELPYPDWADAVLKSEVVNETQNKEAA